jgi:two-component system, NarL family, nitrate/nitrite response regulator NarL
MSSNRIRTTVVVADGHPIFRAALTSLVRSRPELELVGEAAAGREALELIRRVEADVAILARQLPGLDVRDLVETLMRERAATRALILAEEITPEDAYGLIEVGAAGLLPTTVSAEELCDAVAILAGSDTVLPEELVGDLMTQIHARSPTERAVLLTPREHEILADLALGRSAPEIGRLRHLSPATVKTYLHQIYGKLGVSDRAAAVAEGMRRGLIS